MPLGDFTLTLSEEGYECTASVLTDELGFLPTREEGSRFWYEIPDAERDIASGETPGQKPQLPMEMQSSLRCGISRIANFNMVSCFCK